MISPEQKRAIAAQLKQLHHDLGSWSKVAIVAGANTATVSNSMQYDANWHKVADKMWRKVANAIGLRLVDNYWQVVDTVNTDLMQQYLERAQFDSQFIAISHNAGQGKSTGVEMYRQSHEAVFYLECEESWNHLRFMRRMAEILGVKNMSGNVSDLTDDVVQSLKVHATKTRPVLIIDEANKLKLVSLRVFITLFNKLQDEVGMVLIGAHDLKQIIQAGVRRDARGFDELESRLGRTYWQLAGIFKKDVVAICEANGVTDRVIQDRIWLRMEPKREMIGGEYKTVSKLDLRVLKAAVRHEQAQGEMQPTEPFDRLASNAEKEEELSPEDAVLAD